MIDRRSLIKLAASLPCMWHKTHAAAGAAAGDVIDAIDLDGAPGISLAVVHAGRIVVLGGKGCRGPADFAVPGADTLFEIGSLTKTFTASLIFELEAEGSLDVTAPLGEYLSDLPGAWRSMKLSALLSHTSGLPEYLDASNFLELILRDLKPRELIAIAAAKPVQFEPGARHAYNNTGYVLLGMVAETVAGNSYWDQLAKRFFLPTGMVRTGSRNQVEPGLDVATGRLWDGSNWNDRPPVSSPGATFSAGGLVSTARDLARWAIAVDAGELISHRSRRRMWRQAILTDGSPAGWGYGWAIDRTGGRNIVCHGGGTAGFSCWLHRDINAGLTSVVLSNQNGRADPKAMTKQLLTQISANGRPHFRLTPP